MSPANDYLVPANFVTGWDADGATMQDGRSRQEYADSQYATGLDYGRQCRGGGYILIHLDNGRWLAQLTRGAFVSSYECIGLHANTAELLRGFLDSGCEIRVYELSDHHQVLCSEVAHV